MKYYEAPQLKCAMFSSENISAAAKASEATTMDLNVWLAGKGAETTDNHIVVKMEQ